MPLLAVLLALALPLGVGADAQDGVAAGVDGIATVGVQDDVAVDVPAAELAVTASPEGLAVSAPLAGDLAVDLPATLAFRAAPADPAPASGAGSSIDWTPAVTAPAAAAGGSVLGIGLAAALTLARFLGLAPWLPSFSRIEDDELANHPTRRAALDFISSNPGATIQDVRRALGIAWGTTVHHLGRLERAGLVAVRHVGGRRGHWPLGRAPRRDALPDTDRALARLVLAEPGLAQGELARRAGLLAPATSKHLARLQSAGLVSAERDGRQRLYSATPRLAAALA